MMSLQNRYGPWALITGAARAEGLGATFARYLAQRKLNLVLIDILADELQQQAQVLEKTYGISVKPIVLDLGTEDFLEQLQVETAVLEIGLLVCNHMVVTIGKFTQIPLVEHINMLHVNARGYLQLIHFFGRQMIARHRGGVIVISSGAALLPQPYNQHYSAFKAYQLALAEALYGEWQSTGVDVIGVPAPLMNTRDVSGFPQFLVTEPAFVVETIFKYLGKCPRIIPGFWSKLLVFAQTRLMPRHRAIRWMGNLLVQSTGIDVS